MSDRTGSRRRPPACAEIWRGTHRSTRESERAIEADLPGCNEQPAPPLIWTKDGRPNPGVAQAQLQTDFAIQDTSLAITATTPKACPFDHLHQKSRKTDGAD